MTYAYTRLMLCLLPAWLGLALALGCGSKEDRNDGSSGATGAGTGGATAGASGGSGASSSGRGGSAGGGAGAAGAAGTKETTPPPEMPRELGPADGIYCESDFNRPPSQTCPAGSRCCPFGEMDTDPCVPDAGKCQACGHTTCGQLLCDGPEDCSGGQFCCYADRGFCKDNSADCTPEYPNAEESDWTSVDCRERCVGDQHDLDYGIVVCKDDRDCPGPYVEGRCKPLELFALPHGLKVCSGSGT